MMQTLQAMRQRQLLIPLKDFHLEATLDSGQSFGFKEVQARMFEGCIAGTKVRLSQSDKGLHVACDGPLDERQVVHYFDLNKDLSPVYHFLNQDKKLLPALQTYRGLRLLKQDPWEVIACFIISANNNIKRIQLIWKNLSTHFTQNEFTFPTSQAIAESSEVTLRELGLGYRAPYLFKTAQAISREGQKLELINKIPYADAREMLMQYPGIGPKVADCILLHGFSKYESFPIDVWILRMMRKLFYNNRQATPKQILKYAQKKWGPWAGYVQQYIFHAGRKVML